METERASPRALSPLPNTTKYWLSISPFECPSYRQLNGFFCVWNLFILAGTCCFQESQTKGFQWSFVGSRQDDFWDLAFCCFSSCEFMHPIKMSQQSKFQQQKDVLHVPSWKKGPQHGWLLRAIWLFSEWPTERKLTLESPSVFAVKKWQIHSYCTRQTSGQTIAYPPSFLILSFKKHFFIYLLRISHMYALYFDHIHPFPTQFPPSTPPIKYLSTSSYQLCPFLL